MKRMYDCMGVTADVNQRMLFLLGGGATKRFHNHPTIKDNTTASHQWGVAWFCYHLTEGKPSVNLLMAALSHDMAEQVWGDIPSPAKRRLGMDETLTALESATLEENGAFFLLTSEEEDVLTIADRMDCALYAIQERRLGNRNMDTVFEWTRKSLGGMAMTFAQVEIYHALLALWRESCEQ